MMSAHIQVLKRPEIGFLKSSRYPDFNLKQTWKIGRHIPSKRTQDGENVSGSVAPTYQPIQQAPIVADSIRVDEQCPTTLPIIQDCKKDESKENTDDKKTTKEFICSICQKNFASSSNLNRHLKLIHKIIQKTTKQLSTTTVNKLDAVKKVICSVCQKNFLFKSSLNRHLRKVHDISPKQFVCSTCKSCLNSKLDFIKHVEKEHKYSVKSTKLSFDTKEDFDVWKSNIEENTQSKFNKSKTLKTISKFETVKFYCNHNSRRKAATRKSNSNTVERKYFCPANISTKSKEQDKSFPIDVEYCSLHLGHQKIFRNPRCKKIKCSLCENCFSSNSSLNKHMRVFHDAKIKNSTKKLTCSECKLGFKLRTHFLNHLEKDHEINATVENLSFNSPEDFEIWKAKIEKSTASRYIRQHCRKSASGCFIQNYVCHRNGTFKSRSTGKRRLKLTGTNKIGYFCPANIFTKSIEPDKNFPINVTYCSLHHGHQCEIERIPLNKREKDAIVSQLTSGVPLEQILSNITESTCSTKRLVSTNRQILRNILISYGLSNNIAKSKDYVTSVDIWVRQVMENDSNPILIYKLPGEDSFTFPELKEEDFVLGFMNDAQKELFQIYGEDIISIDSTHGTNKYDIQLTSIVVSDENWQGFPTAFLWSNRQAEEVFKYFFKAIKERIGDIKSRTFMSDDYPAFYNAWSLVFGEVEFHLLCDWHVKRALHKNLHKGPHRIENPDKVQNIMADLQTLIAETDETMFKSLSIDFISKLKNDAASQSYCDYFLSTYMNRPMQWAACYRLEANINTNMAIEQWHKQLKYNSNLQGKCGGRLDMAIHSLIKSLRITLLDRLASLTRGKCTKKLSLIRKTHILALQRISDVEVYSNTNDTWIVTSFSRIGEAYKVKKIQNDENHKCNIKCYECNTCLHQYQCSCYESSIRYNFCRHIHVLCQKLNFVEADIHELDNFQ